MAQKVVNIDDNDFISEWSQKLTEQEAELYNVDWHDLQQRAVYAYLRDNPNAIIPETMSYKMVLLKFLRGVATEEDYQDYLKHLEEKHARIPRH